MKKRSLWLAAILACFLLGMAGCKSEPRVSDEEAASAVRSEYETLIGYEEETANDLIRALRDGFDVQVHSIKEQEDSVAIHCTLSNYDVCAAFAAVEASGEEMSLDSYGQALAAALEEQSRLELETELPLVIREDGSLRVTFTEEQLDTAMGGLLSYYEQMVEEAE